MNQIVAVYNFKGGVGKTTSSYYLSKVWSEKYRVLVIDADPQCNLTNLYKSKSGPLSKENQTLFDYIVNFLHDRIPIVKPVEVSNNLHYIPGNYLMIDLESNYQFLEFGLSILHKFFNHIKKDYDLVVVDCPSYFGKTVKYVLGNVDHVIIPATPDIFSIKGILEMLKQLKNIPKNRPIHLLGIFFNRFRREYIYHRKIMALSKRLFRGLLIEKSVRTSVKINEMVEEKSVNKTEENPSHVVKDYEIIGKAITDRLKRKQNGTKKSELKPRLRTVSAE
mgnify:CR=1 FL=1